MLDEGVPAAIVGDDARVRQILVNLLSNAVKFTERGEVFVKASSRALEDGRHEIRFEVRDTGIGIPADRLDRLFHSFSQVDASTTRRYGGTGLGLAICRALAELMGGKIGVDSVVGQGSTFWFTLVAAPAPTLVRANRPAEPAQLAGSRVLVVDDHPTNRDLLSRQVQAWGMVPVAFASPLAALAAVERGDAFDVGILDMQMPEMDGATLATRIRALRDAKSLPLLLLTSLGRRTDVGTRADLFAACLHKPARQSSLFDALASALPHPVARAPERHVGGGVDRGMAERLPLRILLAEDNPVNQKVALSVLGRLGYRADAVANGAEAVDAVARRPYDLVFMDVQMPEVDGLEATRRIRARRARADGPWIVAMTANAMSGDRQDCLAAGMDDYVPKPVEVRALQAALERAAAAIRPGAAPRREKADAYRT
jgi:CheY-like chemotaxis protein